jgi:hypothetical protein
MNTFEVCHQATSSPPPLIVRQPPKLSVQSDILIVQVCSVFCQFLPMEKSFIYDATFKRKIILYADKIGERAAGRKYTVNEAYICHWQV